MTTLGLLTVVVTLLVLIALAREMAPTDVVFVGAVIFLAICGAVTPSQALAGGTNPGVLMVGALFIVAAGLRETGAIEYMGQRFLGEVRTEYKAFLWLIPTMLVTSAFMNNTPIVAMMVPLLLSWCRKQQVPASRLLIPLSFVTILGGTCTLIGTSTNLVIHGLMINSGIPEIEGGLSFFEVSKVGIPCAILGSLYLLTIGRKLLPDRKEALEQFGESRREYMVEMMVQPNCPLVNSTVEGAGLRQLPGLYLIEIDRRGSALSPVKPDEVIESGDRLIFTGIVDTIVDLKKIPGLIPAEDATTELTSNVIRTRRLSEAVVSATSPLIGQTPRQAGFRGLYDAAIVAIHRNGERISNKIGDIKFEPGDTLLLQTGSDFTRIHRNNPDFYLVSDVEDSRPLRFEKMGIAVAIMVAFVASMLLGILDPMLAAFVAAGLMIATRCLTVSEARQSVEWPVLVTIGASFGLGTALRETGAAAYLAGLLVNVTSPWGPVATLAAIYFSTMVLNEMITNNGAAALSFPFCIEAAKLMDVSPWPFLMAVTLAASYAFSSPIGYQTHMMVYGPGGYKFRDFVRVGVPLNLLLWGAAVFLIPRVWSF